jgi:hypothetical protein
LGKGILAVTAASSGYCAEIGRDSIPAHRFSSDWPIMLTYNAIEPRSTNLLLEVDVPAGGDSFRVDPVLDPGLTLSLRIQDETGAPLRGTRVFGRTPIGRMLTQTRPLDTDRVDIQGIDPTRTRPVFLFHPEKNLGGYVFTNITQSESRSIKLEPCGTVRFRLLNKDGQPLANTTIGLRPNGMSGQLAWEFPIGKTDSQGRFESRRFTPNASFRLSTIRVPSSLEIGTDAIRLRPRQELDLGEIRTSDERR